MADRLISCDDHMDLSQLPTKLWTTRLPASLLDRAPHVEERDGQSVWVCDGRHSEYAFGDVAVIGCVQASAHGQFGVLTGPMNPHPQMLHLSSPNSFHRSRPRIR